MGDQYKFGSHNAVEFIDRGRSRFGSPRTNECECPVCFGGGKHGMFACENCRGTGKVKNEEGGTKCPNCSGDLKKLKDQNRFRCEACDEEFWPSQLKNAKDGGKCATCDGTGKVGGKECKECSGTGFEMSNSKDNAKLECMECGAMFSRSNPTADTKCPKCGGYDVDVANSKNNSRAEKIMDIDSSILDKHGKTSGRDLEQFRDEFLSQVRAAGINDEADELEDQNDHTALGILMEARFLKRKRNDKYPSKSESRMRELDLTEG